MGQSLIFEALQCDEPVWCEFRHLLFRLQVWVWPTVMAICNYEHHALNRQVIFKAIVVLD